MLAILVCNEGNGLALEGQASQRRTDFPVVVRFLLEGL